MGLGEAFQTQGTTWPKVPRREGAKQVREIDCEWGSGRQEGAYADNCHQRSQVGSAREAGEGRRDHFSQIFGPNKDSGLYHPLALLSAFLSNLPEAPVTPVWVLSHSRPLHIPLSAW